MSAHELTINGMSCQHCVMALTKALGGIQDLKVVEVQIGKAKVEFDPGDVTNEQLQKAVDKAGFELVS